MSAPSTSGLSVELLLRVIDVKYGYFTLLYFPAASNGGPLSLKSGVKLNSLPLEITRKNFAC